jgi:hypothetical protein
MASGLMAETARLSTFSIAVPDQWTQTIQASSRQSWGSTLSLVPPGGEGVMLITTFEAPGKITQEKLRNLTNVEHSVPLKWQNWGDLAGFQYDYSEGKHSFRQWWLTNEKAAVFVVYQYENDGGGIDSSVINTTVRSIRSVSAL